MQDTHVLIRNRSKRRCAWQRVLTTLMVLSAAVAVFPATALAQGIITTVAGNGVAGYSGDGGPAREAQIQDAYGLALDASGNLYIADWQNNRVRKVTPAGIITTFAGTGEPGSSGDGGPAALARVENPRSVAVDRYGNVYIAEQGNSRIRKVDTTGVIRTVAGNGQIGFATEGIPATEAPMWLVGGVAVDRDGNLYFPDVPNHTVWKVTPNGMLVRFAGGNGGGYSGDGGSARNAQFLFPADVAIDSLGNIYISDNNNNRIRKVTPDGIITTAVGTGNFGGRGDNGPAVNAELTHPLGLAFDSEDNLYIAGIYNCNVRKVSPQGIITTVAGTGTWGFSGDDGPATSAQMTHVLDVTAGGGRLYLSDVYNYRIRMVQLDPIGPELSNLNAMPNPVRVGVAAQLTGTLTDAGGSGLAAAQYTIDGAAPLTVALPNQASTSLNQWLPAFATPGVRTICAHGVDAAGNAGKVECLFLPVYDPSAGFVTGGGTIFSPPGAYAANPALTGKASFGFVSKYLPGATVPEGNTQFRFHAASLDFRSTAYAWLVVAGAKAQLKGVGAIPGSPETYNFLLTAVDGDEQGGKPDTFRIKIWGSGGVVYDNETGKDENGDPSTVLTGGSIVIHK